jgi:endonuclease YncB( thermonuclease family)
MKLKANFIRVVDGDTAYVAIKLRFSNVLAPELQTVAGKAAAKKLRAWARLYDDIEISIAGGIDIYGRLLGVVENNEGVKYE